jgi:hypothetical protein
MNAVGRKWPEFLILENVLNIHRASMKSMQGRHYPFKARNIFSMPLKIAGAV